MKGRMEEVYLEDIADALNADFGSIINQNLKKLLNKTNIH